MSQSISDLLKIMAGDLNLIPKIDWLQRVNSFNSAIHHVVYNNCIDIIKKIDLETIKKASHITNEDGDNVYHISAKNNNLDIFDYFFSMCDDLDPIYVINKSGFSPLRYIYYDHSFVKSLISKKKIRDHVIKTSNNLSFIIAYIPENQYDMFLFFDPKCRNQ